MEPINLQDALGINFNSASDKDKLQVVFKAILKNLRSKADYVDLINTNYSDNPVKGGSVHIDRLAFATVRNYGTAAGNGEGDAVENHGADILVNIDKEIVTEVPRKDARLWRPGGEAELLANTYASQVDALQIFLDDAYFAALEAAATVVDVSDITDADTVKQSVKRLLKLVRTAEAVTGDNINKIDRANLVLTLNAELYDDVEMYMTSLTNPDGNSTKQLHGVEVRRALRQTGDAVCQARGSMGMPMVLDTYTASKPPYKNAVVQELYFSYGVDTVMPEAIFSADVDEDGVPSA